MRPTVIRTSHDARRRSSAALSPDQLHHLSGLADRRCSLAPPSEAEESGPPVYSRRPSWTPDIVLPASLEAYANNNSCEANNVAGSGARTPPRRRSLSPHPQGRTPLTPRRKSHTDHKHPFKRTNTLNLEIRNSNVIAFVMIICMAVLLVLLLGYFINRD